LLCSASALTPQVVVVWRRGAKALGSTLIAQARWRKQKFAETPL
jgi:hypothetical protein